MRPAALLLAALAAAIPAARAGGLVVAESPPDESRLLDVGIRIFDTGLEDLDRPEAGTRDAWRADPDIRRSQALYIPYHLKATLESTGFWGAVRVLPSERSQVDVLVSGEIRRATPKELVLELEFSDATGRTWKRSRFRHEIRRKEFPEPPEGAPRPEPRQELYDDVANALLEEARRLEPGEPERIREVAELRFAAALSPELFGGYLRESGRGRVEPVRLPAEGDPMVERMRRIRERDHAVVDALNEHYGSFYEALEEPYWEWRQFSHEEFMAWKKVRRQARTRAILGGLLIVGGIAGGGGLGDAAILGGAGAVKSGFDKRRQARIHQDALGELAASFGSEVMPLVVEVEGRTLKLEGTARAKYEQWRDLLREIFLEETGLDPRLDAPAPGHAAAAPASLGR